MMASPATFSEHDHSPLTAFSSSANAQIPHKFNLLAAPPCGETHLLNGKERDEVGGNFDCNICLDLCRDPVVTMCGHLFCWSCLYYWLSLHSSFEECPVCKTNVQDRVIPLYGRGKVESADSLAEKFPHIHIPCRPSAIRSSTSAITRNGEPNHSSSEYHGIHTISARNTIPISASTMLGFGLAFLRTYNGGFFSSRRDRNAEFAQRRRFNNKKVFVLHWVFIVVALAATACFFVC